MVPAVRSILLGSPADRPRRYRELLVAIPVFAVVLAAYATGLFSVAGGVVFVPGDAALFGLAAGVVAGFLGRGLLLAWLVAYAALLGYSADHYLLGITHRPILERVAFFLGPDGLVAYAIMALVIGTLAWPVGVVATRAVEAVRGRGQPSTPDRP